MDGKIDTVREALEEARDDFKTLAHSHDGDFDEAGLRNFGSICERQMEEALAALSAIDPEAIRRALRAASNIVKETALEMGLDDEEVFSISGIIDPDIPGNYEDIIEGHVRLSAEPAQDEGKPEVK